MASLDKSNNKDCLIIFRNYSYLPKMGSIDIQPENCLTIDKTLSQFYAPLRDSKDTGFIEEYEISKYISSLQEKNDDLRSRLAILEEQMKLIKPYLPYFPTIIKIVKDYTTVETKIEEKKKDLINQYSLKKDTKLKLWAGAKEKVDIAKTTLDEMLSKIKE